jgi:hypothetical protein
MALSGSLAFDFSASGQLEALLSAAVRLHLWHSFSPSISLVGALALCWRKNHDHISTIEFWCKLNSCNCSDIFGELL